MRVVGKVEDQRTHQRVTLLADATGTLLDIRTQRLALLDAVGNNGLSLLAVVPRLRIAHIAMNTHQGKIDRQLYPAQHAVDVSLVLILILRAEEAASVVGPPRHAGSLYSQSGSNLSAQCFPVVAHIATPYRSTIALNTRIGTTGQDERFLLTASLQPFINGLVDQQGEDVTHGIATPTACIDHAPCQVVVLRLRSILPPGIDAQWHQSLGKVFPVGSSGLTVEKVYPVGMRDIVVVGEHLFAHL